VVRLVSALALSRLDYCNTVYIDAITAGSSYHGPTLHWLAIKQPSERQAATDKSETEHSVSQTVLFDAGAILRHFLFTASY